MKLNIELRPYPTGVENLSGIGHPSLYVRGENGLLVHPSSHNTLHIISE